MSMAAKKTKADPLGKRVPKSNKYDHIQGRLDTGMTAPKMKVVSVREFSRRREEIYYRVQREQMEMLYEEYDSRENDESMGHMSSSGGISALSLGGDRGPTIVTHEDEAKPVYDRPYVKRVSLAVSLCACRYAPLTLSHIPTFTHPPNNPPNHSPPQVPSNRRARGRLLQRRPPPAGALFP